MFQINIIVFCSFLCYSISVYSQEDVNHTINELNKQGKIHLKKALYHVS